MDTLIPELRNRLEGAILQIPSLKERRTEIPHQVQAFLAGRRTITPDALAELARHRWEGNLVELRAAVDRLVALSGSRIGRKLVRQILAKSTLRPVKGRLYVRRPSRLEPALAQ
jgi:DNA-binding NtrC family response regulator